MRAFLAFGFIVVSTFGCVDVNEEPGAPAAPKPTAAPPAMPAQQPAVMYRGVISNPALIAAIDLPTVRGGVAQGVRTNQLEPVALVYNTMFTGVTVSRDGRTFFNFPRWTDRISFTVAEFRTGQLVPYPDPQRNDFDYSQPTRLDPREQLVSVQSVVIDDRNRLWALDTGNVNMQGILPGAPKMVGFDLATNQPVKTIRFPETVVKSNTYLNDVRFNLNRGAEGMAFITDSGDGAIIVVDLASGESWRRLDDHPSTQPVPAFTPIVEGAPMQKDPPDMPPAPIQIAADGIALSPDRKTLYYTPLSGRTIYSVSVDALADRNLPEQQVAQTVRVVTNKPSANDGLICDDRGRIYSTDFEDNAIRRIDPQTGSFEIVAQDERLLWPDSLWIHAGHLYITANQLNRQGTYHNGEDQRQSPYVLFRLPLAGPEPTRR